MSGQFVKGSAMRKLYENLYLYEDTCHVYVIKNESGAVLIDFGSGSVLEELASIGVDRVTDVLMTHHHRDQGQGLEKAIEVGAKVWVPHTEQDLFSEVDVHWQAREVDNNYNMRQDRFSLLNSIPIAGTLKDYQTYSFNGLEFEVIPTPGHTVGSISLSINLTDKKLAFTGDLIAGPGKVWSIAATQWTYNGAEGAALSILSLLDLRDKRFDVLLPSHGEMIDDPEPSIDLLVDRFHQLLKHRNQNPRLFQLREKPYENITSHLLKNRTSMSNSYVLLSESGKALVIDFGYDFIGGIAAGADRASRRPWLYTLDKLKKDYNVSKIDVALPTHFHDDHVAGFNLLQNVEGTEIWCPENFAPIFENPKHYDLPCLWYDPISVDRVLPLEKKLKWEEYEFELYEQSGHTLYAVAIVFEVDGKRVLAQGDQYAGDGHEWNYVYRNGFRHWDYRESAELYQKVKPDLLISGHWDPVEVNDQYLADIMEKGKELERLHEELLPLESVDLGAGGFAASITPYQSLIPSGETFSLSIAVKNPFSTEEEAVITFVTPDDWMMDEEEYRFRISGKEEAELKVSITVPFGKTSRRERVAADITIGNTKFGQQAEALITVE
jgi:glyoxylase-like metal-dependent hydrolase (beta-lactamase superfamily II)